MHNSETCPLPAGAAVWGYLRDSGGPSQERSTDQQRDILEAYCQQHELVLERVFVDSAQQGDSAEDRSGLWELITEARARFPQIHNRRRREELAARLEHGVIFWSFSRLGRDRLETTWIKNDLRMRGLIVTSLADDILTGNEALDPILEELLAFKHQMDLEVIGREARRGLHSIVQLRDDDPGFLAHTLTGSRPGATWASSPIVSFHEDSRQNG
jgi:DNA invertase Pin-like site-specific DNA recombinase